MRRGVNDNKVSEADTVSEALSFETQSAQQVKEGLVKAFILGIANCVVRSHARILSSIKTTRLLDKRALEIVALV